MDLRVVLKGFGGKTLWNESLSRHTSLRVGGAADAYVFPQHVDELAGVFKRVMEHNIPYLVLGDGSNLLVSDEGFRGIVFNLSKLDQLKVLKKNTQAVEVFVGAGLRKQKMLSWAMRKALSGVEFLSGVPGQMGGGLFMNAGTAYGCFGDVVQRIHMLNSAGGQEVIDVGPQDFSYRAQRFCKNKIITGAVIRLIAGDRGRIAQKVGAMIADRKAKQPLALPSCGSTFKNPPGQIAGRLIQSAGLCGYRVGQAMVSEKHANFIVNLGGARADHVFSVLKYVERRVKEVHGIHLEREVVVIANA